ncbi:hypothetical protein [Deinococcus radiotolerans]|uniref:HeH/LEM domain-containing protein n=1 Tax=Deinococcus radiotolerans TaxID=1309407 RepID=A0ABQ2FQ38_9DEIO|nr:hypothetical protein [Deinococcus radiotolerans]GGL15832.1 hypothetical protein GCM10010844_38430 [Deinococcus radiotolerans]
MSEQNPQDITPTFQRRTPSGKWETVDHNGKPVDGEKAEASAASKGADDDQGNGQGSANTPQATDRRTVPQLTAALTAKGITIPDAAKRDDLVKLAADNGA